MLHVKECVYVVWLVKCYEKEEEQRDCQCVDNDRNSLCYFVICAHTCTDFVGTKINKKCQTSLKMAFNPCILPKFNVALVPVTIFFGHLGFAVTLPLKPKNTWDEKDKYRGIR